MKTYYVYILANQQNGTIYIGVTSDLIKRMYQHKQGMVGGFTKKYHVDKLVYYEDTTDVNAAIQREKQLKKWYREWKLELIEESNPQWRDLYYELVGNGENSKSGFPRASVSENTRIVVSCVLT